MSSTPAVPKYNEDLRADIETSVNDSPKVKVHRVEWAKVCCETASMLLHQKQQLLHQRPQHRICQKKLRVSS
jgi:hypothetical protein